MSENTDPNRVFDEIEFADNSVPAWWLPAFACTALFSVVYWVFYHGGAEQRTKEDLYGIALAQNTSLRSLPLQTDGRFDHRRQTGRSQAV